mmetsp:Transcript_13622/g.32365  ORF Transcript_13622/g.32365 Transcript_13622/m.32365 type:complete len:214 (+) Transcript_13622:1326-1967(+)
MALSHLGTAPLHPHLPTLKAFGGIHLPLSPVHGLVRCRLGGVRIAHLLPLASEPFRRFLLFRCRCHRFGCAGCSRTLLLGPSSIPLLGGQLLPHPLPSVAHALLSLGIFLPPQGIGPKFGIELLSIGLVFGIQQKRSGILDVVEAPGQLVDLLLRQVGLLLVGMQLESQPAVGLGNFPISRTNLETEHLIRIATLWTAVLPGGGGRHDWMAGY